MKEVPVGQDALEVETQMADPHLPRNMSLESTSEWPVIAHPTESAFWDATQTYED